MVCWTSAKFTCITLADMSHVTSAKFRSINISRIYFIDLACFWTSRNCKNPKLNPKGTICCNSSFTSTIDLRMPFVVICLEKILNLDCLPHLCTTVFALCKVLSSWTSHACNVLLPIVPRMESWWWTMYTNNRNSLRQLAKILTFSLSNVLYVALTTKVNNYKTLNPTNSWTTFLSSISGLSIELAFVFEKLSLQLWCYLWESPLAIKYNMPKL